MKFIKNLFIGLFVLMIVGACENLDMEGLQEDPNNPSPETADLNDLYNNIQLEFNAIFQSAEGNPGAASRMYMITAYTYRNMSPNTTFNGLWGNAYNDMFPDIEALLALAEGQDFGIHTGTAKIMKAYTLMVLVDLLGDVPNTEALQGTNVISPAADPGVDVYNFAIALLDEAIDELSNTGGPKPNSDSFYGGDLLKWITAANTIKLRAALNTNDVGTINALSSGDIISSASDDFQFNFGSQRANPDSRAPKYLSHYEQGDGAYVGNYYMWLLRTEKGVIDPRIRYYFYRKVDDSIDQDLTTFSCHFSSTPDPAFTPAHYIAVDPNMPYCVASADGYTGRDHLNGEGIPPDGPIRTSFGLYPWGGDFDNDEFDVTQHLGTTGGLGEGISPILLSSTVDFMLAEAVLRLSAAGDARVLLESGIRASLDKVESFEGLVAAKMGTNITLRDGSSGTVKEVYGMDAAAKDSYVATVLAIYDAPGANQLDVVIKEHLIAAYGNGLEAYNMYRRTGLPANMAPSMEPSGPFPLSFFYPANTVDRNANIAQKDGLTQPVFWQDAGVASVLY